MAMIAVWLKVEEDRALQALQAAEEKLDGSEGEVVLDFSSVRRVDPDILKAMDTLASVADGKNVRVVLRGVNVEIYKVLKIVKLTKRFSFVT